MAAAIHTNADTTYTFSNQPRAAPGGAGKNKAKYRDPLQSNEGDGLHYGNLMWDRRVIRGSTYGQTTLPTHGQPDPVEVQRQQELRRRAVARRRARQQLRPRTPEAVTGRHHQDIQTELYLEELSDRIEEADVDTQTDAFLDRPPTPMFVPAKSGADVETQIYENDLFDFDIEVKPILEVLVGKTVEQSLLEVAQEEELSMLRQQQREFQELRNAELVEQQRLEEQERRHRDEKERRIKQQREILAEQKQTAEKIAAQAFAQSYLAGLVPSVFGTLSDYGYFYDAVERDIEQGFVNWLMESVEKRLEVDMVGRRVLDGLIREVVLKRAEEYRLLAEREAEAAKPKIPEPEAPAPVAADVGAGGGGDMTAPGETGGPTIPSIVHEPSTPQPGTDESQPPESLAEDGEGEAEG